MNLKARNHIDEETFVALYRAHCHIKFHMHRYMVLSVLLLCFGELMERGFHMEFGFLNSMVFVLVIASIGLNLLADYVMPKQAYRNLVSNHMHEGVITITDESLKFGEGRQVIEKPWTMYTSCFETEQAFLIYQKDLFTVLLKSVLNDQTDHVRLLLQKKVNKGKPLKVKK